MVWVNLKGLRVERDGLLVIALLARSVPLCVEHFCLLLQDGVDFDLLTVDHGCWGQSRLLLCMVVS